MPPTSGDRMLAAPWAINSRLDWWRSPIMLSATTADSSASTLTSEIDVNVAIASLIDIRLGNQPDPRIMVRSVKKTRDFSILVLLDLSESTNEKVQDQEYSVRELTKQACVLLWRMPSIKSVPRSSDQARVNGRSRAG